LLPANNLVKETTIPRQRLYILSLLLGVALAVLTSRPAVAANALASRFENDSFGNTDENYSNGISLAATTRGAGPFGWVWDIVQPNAGQRYATYELTQLQFTPSDLSRTVPDPRDRPYAGLLYLGLASHLRQKESLQSLKLLAGIVGPASYAEGLQNATHHILAYNAANGWDHQLRNEPIINLLYEYRQRYHLTPGTTAIGVELIPMGGVFLGNYLTQGEVHLQGRIGYHLPDDFGVTTLRGSGYLPFPEWEQPGHSWGVYAFAGGGVNIVGWNITLDGNTIAESPRVNKRLLLPAIELGAALWTRSFQTTFSYVLWGREFTGQPYRENFGSILLSYNY
jgi:hypothetical protein